jgi:hypothetical protein
MCACGSFGSLSFYFRFASSRLIGKVNHLGRLFRLTGFIIGVIVAVIAGILD